MSQHRKLHTSSTACTQYRINPRSTVTGLQPVSLHSRNAVVTPECGFSQRCATVHIDLPQIAFAEHQGKVSHSKQCELTNEWSLNSQSTTSKSTTSNFAQSLLWSACLCSNHCSLKVHLWTNLIKASKCLTQFVQSQALRLSLTLLYHSLQVHLWIHLFTTSNWISEFIPYHALSESSKFRYYFLHNASQNSLNHGLNLHVSVQFTWFWASSASLNSLDGSLQVNLWVHSISGSRWSSKLAPS